MREVRIRDTLAGELRTLDPEQEVGIYACGPTVYSRIHIGNARPFVVFSLLARFLRSEGYRAKLVVNVTDVNDKIYTAAGEAGEESAAFAGRMTRAYFDDTDRLGLGRPDAEPLATETIDGIVALISDLIEAGRPTSRGATSTSEWAASTATASSPTGAPRTWTRVRRRLGVAQGGPARLRPLEGAQARRGHVLGFALGPGAARLAHRVLGDGRGRAGPFLRDPRRRLGPGLSPSRERDRPVGGRGASLCPGLDAQRHGRDRCGEDVEVGGQHLPARPRRWIGTGARRSSTT